MHELWTLYFDGLCEPTNPGGRMAWGWVLQRPSEQDVVGGGTEAARPENTNNVAEYYALGFALQVAIEHANGIGDDRRPELEIRGDSKLVCCQVSGEWRCRDDRMARLRDRCLELLKSFFTYRIEWVPREENEVADNQSRLAWAAAENGQEPPSRGGPASGRPEDFVVAFGKHRGKTLSQVLADDAAYLDWMADADWEDRPGLGDAVRAMCRTYAAEIEKALASSPHRRDVA